MKKTIILLMLLGLAVQGIQAQEIILRPDNIEQVIISFALMLWGQRYGLIPKRPNVFCK